MCVTYTEVWVNKQNVCYIYKIAGQNTKVCVIYTRVRVKIQECVLYIQRCR